MKSPITNRAVRNLLYEFILPGGLCALFLFLLSSCATDSSPSRHAGPWDIKELSQTPSTAWGSRTGLVQELYYQGSPYEGKSTRVFAYLGRPAEGSGPYPAMVLVHGGGGKAFRAWAEHWAQRGYVALAMDTAGCGPKGPLPDGGPGQADEIKFRNFSENDLTNMWSYHAVADVIRGCSLLGSLPEVDRDRIGITGISWGGYLTCIAAAVDHRFKVAVPVYGCGFLGRDSWWTTNALAQMNPAARALWLKEFDPSMYLSEVQCPILFLNGATDFAYHLDSYRASYRLVNPRLRNISVIIKLAHGHNWHLEEVDSFVDSAVKHGQPIPRLGDSHIHDRQVSATVYSPVPLKSAFLNYTTDQGDWQQRKWTIEPAEIVGDTISGQLPEKGYLAYYLSVVDTRGLRVSTEYEETSP